MLISNGCSELDLQLGGFENKWNISVRTLKEGDGEVPRGRQSMPLAVPFGRQRAGVQSCSILKIQRRRSHRS